MKKDIDFIKQVLEPGGINRHTEEFTHAFEKIAFNKIVAIETLGFALGGALAAKLNKSLVLIRKGGVSETANPEEFIELEASPDHSGSKKTFRIWKKSIIPGDRIALIDDYAATTSAIRAAAKLLSGLGAKIEVAGLISADSKSQYILEHEHASQYVAEPNHAFKSIILARSKDESRHKDRWEKDGLAKQWWTTLFDKAV